MNYKNYMYLPFIWSEFKKRKRKRKSYKKYWMKFPKFGKRCKSTDLIN